MTDQTRIPTVCPTCGQRARAQAALAGKVVRCPRCHDRFRVAAATDVSTNRLICEPAAPVLLVATAPSVPPGAGRLLSPAAVLVLGGGLILFLLAVLLAVLRFVPPGSSSPDVLTPDVPVAINAPALPPLPPLDPPPLQPRPAEAAAAATAAVTAGLVPPDVWAWASDSALDGDLAFRVEVWLTWPWLTEFGRKGRTDDRCTLIWLHIENRSKTVLRHYAGLGYVPRPDFRLKPLVARLSDEHGNRYYVIVSKIGQKYEGQFESAPIYPSTAITDTLIFEKMSPTTRELRLELPAEAWGGSGVLRLRILRSGESMGEDWVSERQAREERETREARAKEWQQQQEAREKEQQASAKKSLEDAAEWEKKLQASFKKSQEEAAEWLKLRRKLEREERIKRAEEESAAHEADAARKLKLAMTLINDSIEKERKNREPTEESRRLMEYGCRRLREIVQRYPTTKAAEECRKLLKEHQGER